MTAVAASVAAAVCAVGMGWPRTTKPTRGALRRAGAASGFLDGLAGIGGPPLARVYAGHEGAATAGTAGTCAPALVVGAMLGCGLAARVRPGPARRVVSAVILLGAATVLVG